MRRAFRVVLTAVGALALSGCLPNGMIVWSPDGSRAAIVSKGKLLVTDTRGKLIDPGVENVRTVAWDPTGDELLVFLNVELETWDELVEALGADEAAVVEADARRALALAKARGREYVENHTAELLGDDSVHAANVVLCLWSRHEQELRALMAEDEDAADRDEQEPPAGRAVRLRRMKLAEGTLRDIGAVWTLGQDVWSPAVHPSGKWVAWHGGGLLGEAMGLDGGKVTIASASKAGPVHRLNTRARGRLAWIDEGRSLLCLRPVAEKGPLEAAMVNGPDEGEAIAGQLARIQVLRDVVGDGRLADDLGHQEPEAGAVVFSVGYQPLKRVGGKIVLQAWKTTLRFDPAMRAPDTRAEPTLRTVTLGKEGPELTPIPLPDAVGPGVDDGAMALLPSPDGSRLAAKSMDQLTIYDAASGQKLHEDDDFVMPVRGSWIHFHAGKAYYIARRRTDADAKGRICLVCWDGEKVTDLSAKWPEGLLSGFVEKPPFQPGQPPADASDAGQAGDS